MKWFVTGGCGFIGQELVHQLSLDGHDVVVYDAMTKAATGAKRVASMSGVKVINGDVCDSRLLERSLYNYMPDVVVHMAAQSHVDESLESPISTWDVNAIGTQNVAMQCAVFGIPMLYCSTDEVYGTTPIDSDGAPVPVSEDHPFDPSSPYSASKAAGEYAVRVNGKTLGLRWAITRGSNAFGPNQFCEKLIPIACSLLHSKYAVPLHGGGSQLRQWIHVSEFAEALVLAATALFNGHGEGKTWNIAGPDLISVKRLVGLIAENMGLDPASYVYDAVERPAQDFRYAVSGKSMEDGLGWKATRKLTERKEIESLVAHYSENHNAPSLAQYVITHRSAQ